MSCTSTLLYHHATALHHGLVTHAPPHCSRDYKTKFTLLTHMPIIDFKFPQSIVSACHITDNNNRVDKGSVGLSAAVTATLSLQPSDVCVSFLLLPVKFNML
jgi:hypothetical protein